MKDPNEVNLESLASKEPVEVTPRQLSLGDTTNVPNIEDIAAPGQANIRLSVLWTGVAARILIIIAIFFLLLFCYWGWVEYELRTQFLPDIKNQVAGALEAYKALSQQTFDCLWKFVERIIIGGFFSLLTLIVGYIFGERSR